MDKCKIFASIKGRLIVSCQALENEPLCSPFIMGRMALAAKIGGAACIRANSKEDICEIKRIVDLPVIGLKKINYPGCEVYITPTLKEVFSLIESGADVIAFDATSRQRPGNVSIKEIICEIKAAGRLAMADISTFEEGVAAEAAGADIISTTMSGYTLYSPETEGPDYRLIYSLSKKCNIPVIAEGRVKTPEQMLECFSRGAYSVVVGGAITRPQIITRDFVRAIDAYKNGKKKDEVNVG